MSAIVASFHELAERPLWPGFEPAHIPLAIFDGTDTWLFGHPKLPAEFVAPGIGAPARCAGRHPAVSANSSADIGGVMTGTLLLDPASTRSARSLAGIAIHETFHVFQGAHHPAWNANEADLFVYPFEDAVALAERRLESTALVRAIKAGDASEARLWSSTALALRATRAQRIGAAAIAYERGTELKEGLAQYLEDKALGASASARFPTDEFAPDAVRQRGYAAGQAWAVLLDRFRPSWIEALSKRADASLDALLAEALGEATSMPLAFDAAQETSARAHAERDTAQWLDERKQRRRAFLDAPGWSVRIVCETEALGAQGFDPLNVLRLGEREVLHTRFVKLGNERGSVEALNVSVLSIAAGAHPLFDGVREVVVTGLAVEPRVVENGDVSEIVAEGLTVRLRGARIEREDRMLTLRLPPASK